METPHEPDDFTNELNSLRKLIAGQDNIQKMIDLAADEADRRTTATQDSARLAWRVTGAFGVLSLVAFGIAGGAVATSMQPPPPPQVLVVDRTNGIVQPLISLAAFQMDPTESTVRRNVNTFLLAREGYSYDTAETNYYTAAAFMSPQLQAAWIQNWAENNPESPVNKYKKARKVRIKIGAIMPNRNEKGVIYSVRVSFVKTELVNDVPDGEPTNWIATIPFRWVNQSTNERDRRINDLGWQVTDYTVDRDLGNSRHLPLQEAKAPEDRKATSPLALVAPGQSQQASP